MNIEIKGNWYGIDLIIEADNVNIKEDITEPIYALREDGKKDFTQRLGQDIKEEYLDLFARALDDMIYYRKSEYNFPGLILNLFDKLPENQKEIVLKELNNG